MADVRGARLFADLNSCFRRDPLIDEYDLLPKLEPTHNMSPLMIVEHKLGVEAWCVKILFKYCYDRLLDWRSKEGDAKFAHPQEVSGLSRAVLLIQPDCYTAWNIRKELIENGDLSISDDLKLGALILTKHPKSAETYIHRRWVLQRLLNQCLSSSNDSNASNNSVEPNDGCVNMDAIGMNFLPAANHNAQNNHMLQFAMHRDVLNVVQEELKVCSLAADKYPCNYHAWSHRIWTLQHCYNCSLNMLISELNSTETWVSKHISDHSGFHYRQFLLGCLVEKGISLQDKFSLSLQDLLEKELLMVLDLISLYPGHEALWYHRKYVFHSLHHSFSRPPPTGVAGRGHNGGSGQDSVGGHSSSCIGEHQGQKKFKSENNEQQGLVLKELDSVSHKAMHSTNKYHKLLASRYKDWVQRCFSH